MLLATMMMIILVPSLTEVLCTRKLKFPTHHLLQIEDQMPRNAMNFPQPQPAQQPARTHESGQYSDTALHSYITVYEVAGLITDTLDKREHYGQ